MNKAHHSLWYIIHLSQQDQYFPKINRPKGIPFLSIALYIHICQCQGCYQTWWCSFLFNHGILLCLAQLILTKQFASKTSISLLHGHKSFSANEVLPIYFATNITDLTPPLHMFISPHHPIFIISKPTSPTSLKWNMCWRVFDILYTVKARIHGTYHHVCEQWSISQVYSSHTGFCWSAHFEKTCRLNTEKI